MNRSTFFRNRVLCLWCAFAVSAACLGCGDSPGKRTPGSETPAAAKLPDNSSFVAEPSDRFLVDLSDISGGRPFRGINSAQPHACAHVHFDNSANVWPKEGTDPANYPAIYAVADGIVGRIDTQFPLSGGNVRYGLDLAFAKDRTGATYQFCYSIEPIAPEPAEGFYKKFILVDKGQRIRKGELLAYLYTPPKTNGCHIHFHLTVDGLPFTHESVIFHSAGLGAVGSEVEVFAAECDDGLARWSMPTVGRDTLDKYWHVQPSRFLPKTVRSVLARTLGPHCPTQAGTQYRAFREVTSLSPTGVERSAEPPGKTAFSRCGGATGGAMEAEVGSVNPDLTVIFEAWPRLPEPVKAAIVALARAVAPEQAVGNAERTQ